MSTTCLFVTWLLAAQASEAPAAPDAARATPPAAFDLGPAKATRVLYAGVPGTERGRSFLEFLRASFTDVGELDLAKLSTETARGWDVIVADGPRMYPMKPEDSLPSAGVTLTASFTRPIVMISAAGGQVQHHSKIDWL